ncbi:MAG: LysM peptidoglycan-binding domain-containing protein [Anaerolineae bacterium]|nr:LysM peptidoglycan-binding domain-containing protein [Anaerolineae bacterium]
MEPSPQRRCPQCGTPVAQRAENCLMCGALLKESKRRRARAPEGDLLWPILIVVGLIAIWLWKPWQGTGPQAMAPMVEPSPVPTSTSATPTVTPTVTPSPSPTYYVAPTATPLYSPTPPPTPTLPPNYTEHRVEEGDVVSTIAKEYGTTTDSILKANGLKANTTLHVGQTLIIPLPIANTLTPTITPTPSPTPFVYTIKSGDLLSVIAKRYNTTVEALMEANDIADATRISVGTKIIIVQPPDYAATMAYDTYEVQPGDTLITIADKYSGVTVKDLRDVNELKSDSLKAGQTLRVPIGTATPTPTLTPPATLTPTPAPKWPAPALLMPADDASFDPSHTSILLTWASVGILDEDEWYVVHLRRSGEFSDEPAVWTKATSWRVSREVLDDHRDGPQRFYWSVVVMQHTEGEDDRIWTGELVGSSSDTRTFSWW